MFDLGMKLNFRPTTITTAAHIFHAFFEETDIKLYDMYVSITKKEITVY